MDVYATAKNESFSQKLPGSAAVLFRPTIRRDFTPPFTETNGLVHR